MKRIESRSNPEIKGLQRMIARGDFGRRWIVEGKVLFLDALSSGVKFEQMLVTAAMLRDIGRALQELPPETQVFEVSASVMRAVSTLETPPGIIGIALQETAQPRNVIHTFAALLLSVRDPGNLGALVRSAEASGCEFLACSADCADPRQPKVVRASMGSIFRVPVFKVPDTDAYLKDVRAHSGVKVYTLVPRDGKNLYRMKPQFPALVVVGGETGAISTNFDADEQVTIPMKGRVESLNTAMAGTLCFYRFLEEKL